MLMILDVGSQDKMGLGFSLWNVPCILAKVMSQDFEICVKISKESKFKIIPLKELLKLHKI
jgi:hypothetical protein